MAIISAQVGGTDTPVAIGQETWRVNFNDQTSALVTPSFLKSIDNFSLAPINATAATSVGAYANAFVVGSATITLTGVNNAIYLVTIYGRI
jgi:hypothetical protein